MGTSSARPALLLIDHDGVFRAGRARALRDRGLEVRVAADTASAIAMAREDPPEMAVVDLKLPGGSGLEVVREMAALDPATAIVVLTGYGSIATAVEAIKLGATHYLAKPADADEILAALGRGSRPVDPGDLEPVPPTLARAEWEHMHRVLSDCAGNVSEAARRLGLHRRSLQRKLGRNPPLR